MAADGDPVPALNQYAGQTVDPYMAMRMGAAGGGDADMNMLYGSGQYDPGAGALARGSAALTRKDLEPGPDVQNLRAYGAAYQMGSPEEVKGALSRQDLLRDQSAQQKMAAIQRAMSILQASGQHDVNLPALAAAGALMGPTRTGSFGESLSNAVGSAVPQIQRQREIERANALATGQLGIEGADVGIQQSKEQQQDLIQRAGIGERFEQAAGQAYVRQVLSADRLQAAGVAAGSRTDVANINAGARVRSAQILGGSRLGVADINANKERWQYLGTDPNDPNTGLYFDQTHGQVNPGPAVAGRPGQTSKQITDAQWLVQNKIAPDLSTAYAMVRSGVNEGSTFQRLVQGEKNTLLKTPQGMTMTPQELESFARETVVARAQSGGLKVGAPTVPATGAPAAAPGGQAGAPAAPAAPKVGPPLPPGIPKGSLYNPSRGLWRDPAGKIYDSTGKPAALPGG